LHVRPDRVEELLAMLHGRKHLVTGNNDGPATLEAKGWSSVQAYREINVAGIWLVLCHYAFRTWKNMGRGWIDLHGHSHGKLKKQTRQYDVGVDAWDYRPVTLDTILGRRAGRAAKTAERETPPERPSPGVAPGKR
jgi:calcineurin-like phosphoesterase family protein